MSPVIVDSWEWSLMSGAVCRDDVNFIGLIASLSNFFIRHMPFSTFFLILELDREIYVVNFIYPLGMVQV